MAGPTFGAFGPIHVAPARVGPPIPARYPPAPDLAAGVVWLALGAGGIVRADAITRLAYRGRRGR